MKILFFLIVIIALISCKKEHNNATWSNDSSKNDTIIFQYSGFNNSIKLLLIGNNKFVYGFERSGCLGGGEELIVKGNFIKTPRKLLLQPDSVFFTFIPCNSNSYPNTFKCNYGIKSLRIKTIYDIIYWGKTIYLISAERDRDFRTHLAVHVNDSRADSISNIKNDYYDLALCYNLRLGAKEYGRFLTLDLDSLNIIENTELDLKQIPDEWRCLFNKDQIELK
jgi:hypothetical protein